MIVDLKKLVCNLIEKKKLVSRTNKNWQFHIKIKNQLVTCLQRDENYKERNHTYAKSPLHPQSFYPRFSFEGKSGKQSENFHFGPPIHHPTMMIEIRGLDFLSPWNHHNFTWLLFPKLRNSYLLCEVFPQQDSKLRSPSRSHSHGCGHIDLE